jgi:hypothetical protein
MNISASILIGDRIDKMLEYVDEVLEWRVSLTHLVNTRSADMF